MTAIDSPISSLESQIAALAPWFHNLHLTDSRGETLETSSNHWLGDFPNFKWQQIRHALPKDLTGCSCLDIGCNAGFYSFELAKRGATVLGIDPDPHYLTQARWAARHMGLQSQVTFERLQVYDLARDVRRFDLVLFLGVFYHLRYPVLALDIVAQKVKRLLLFQTLTTPGDDVFTPPANLARLDFDESRNLLNSPGFPKLAFLEHGFAGDPTNTFAPNHAACEALLRSAGLQILSRPAHEFYLCSPNPDRPSAMTTWNRAEYLVATGLSEERDLATDGHR